MRLTLSSRIASTCRDDAFFGSDRDGFGIDLLALAGIIAESAERRFGHGGVDTGHCTGRKSVRVSSGELELQGVR